MMIVPGERVSKSAGQHTPTRSRTFEWIIGGTIMFGGVAVWVAPDRIISALLSAALAAAVGAMFFDRALLWGSAMSRICLVSAIVLPIVFVVLVSTSTLPKNSLYRNNVLLCFVVLQAVALFLDLASLLGVGREVIRDCLRGAVSVFCSDWSPSASCGSGQRWPGSAR
jgi:hypothetical protein